MTVLCVPPVCCVKQQVEEVGYAQDPAHMKGVCRSHETIVVTSLSGVLKKIFSHRFFTLKIAV